MCGIAGVFGKPDRQVVESMVANLIHRGPDDGYVVDGERFALGARRLSIVDLEGGRQPLSNEDGTIWAAQNGELYNYPIASKAIQAKGHKLATRCDTELLPHLYEEYGSRLPEHIDGMFAVAVWDTKNRIGILARDRMGKKPLYYYQQGDALYFASELKSLLCVPGFQRRINLEAVHHFLSFKHIPCPLTIFEGVYVLPPAHSLVFKPGMPPEIQRYWSLDFSPSPAIQQSSEEDLVEQLLELLRNGIKRRLMSDVPIGFFLSGGIDSSLSTALAAEMADSPIKTFTLTYADRSSNQGKDLDRKWASWTAEKYKTEHFEESVKFSDFPENLRRVIRCFDEPFAGTISTYFLAGLIAKHVKVAISGDGADELFGSYLSHRLAFPLANLPRYRESGDSKLIAPFDNQVDYLEKLYEPTDWSWRSKLFVLSEEEKRGLYRSDLKSKMSAYSSTSRLCSDFENLTGADPLNRMLEAEFKTIFADQVLTFVDRLSMAHALEVRSAYLDTELVNFAAKLPGRMKINDGQTKYILKKAALKYFPEEMVFRPKEGFVMPITQWFLNDLQGYVREVLSPERLNHHGMFEQASVNRLIDEAYAPNADYRQVNKVFSLIVFQEWYDIYIRDAAQASEGALTASR